ncbi:regulator of G-protein signaling 10 [Gastrophryne carolinensis]
MFTRAVTRLGRKRPPSEIHGNDSTHLRELDTKGTQKWSQSLESLLEEPAGVAAFQDFLSGEFSEENLLFWLACEDFRKTDEEDQLQKKAEQIYRTFLSSKAPSPVNVESQSRISEQILNKPHPLMFEKLQEQIFQLMKYDSYRRFLRSEIFQKLHSCQKSDIPTAAAEESAPKRASRTFNVVQPEQGKSPGHSPFRCSCCFAYETLSARY